MLRAILNHNQNAANLIKMYQSESPCCGDAGQDCLFEANYPLAQKLVSLTFQRNGSNVEIAVGTTAGDAPGVVMQKIYAALEIAGFEEAFKSGDQTPKGVSVTVSGANNQLAISGDIKLVSLKHTVATVVNFAAKCTEISVCRYTASVVYGNITVNGVPLPGGAYGTGSAATIQTDLAAELTAQGIAFSSVTVTELVAVGKFQLDIFGQSAIAAVDINDAKVTRCECNRAFIV